MAYPMESATPLVIADRSDERDLAVPAGVLPLSGADRPATGAAAAVVRSVLDEQLLDELVAGMRGEGVRLSGPGGFLTEMLKAVLERGLQAELTQHLGYDKHDPAGNGSGNSRNGSTPKTVLTEVGPVPLDVPRDRAGTFTPTLVPKGERRLGGLSDIIISLYAGAMFEDAALAVGAAVVPAGVGNAELQVHLAATVGVNGYVGLPSYLKLLIDTARTLNLPFPVRRALVTAEPLPDALREGEQTNTQEEEIHQSQATPHRLKIKVAAALDLTHMTGWLGDSADQPVMCSSACQVLAQSYVAVGGVAGRDLSDCDDFAVGSDGDVEDVVEAAGEVGGDGAAGAKPAIEGAVAVEPSEREVAGNREFEVCGSGGDNLAVAL